MTNILAFQLRADRAPAADTDGSVQRWIAAGEGLGRALKATAGAVRGFARSVAQAREAQARYMALSHLSDGALADRGLTRGDIGRIVAGAFEIPAETPATLAKAPAARPAPRAAEDLPVAA